VIDDMPFLSYQVSDEKAVENAGRFLKEANVDAIKPEGGTRVAGRIRAIAEAGIPGGWAHRAHSDYCKDVREGSFPGEEHCYRMIEGEEKNFMELMKRR
jgi:ketopantoate hydroxymethyltransferase